MSIANWDVAMIDPPWDKKKGGKRSVRPNQDRELDYATMDTDSIFDLLDRDVFNFAAATHSVFLWTVDQFMQDAERSMEIRGYKRHARLIWDKQNGVAPAFSVRYTHEYLIWWYRPKFTPVAFDARGRYPTVMVEKSRQHSRKPECAYRMIEHMFPNANKVDVFSRQKRMGWDQYGDQPSHFDDDFGLIIPPIQGSSL